MKYTNFFSYVILCDKSQNIKLEITVFTITLVRLHYTAMHTLVCVQGISHDVIPKTSIYACMYVINNIQFHTV